MVMSVGKSEPGCACALVSLTSSFMVYACDHSSAKEGGMHFWWQRMMRPALLATEGGPGRPCDGQLAISEGRRGHLFVCLFVFFSPSPARRDVRGSRGLRQFISLV